MANDQLSAEMRRALEFAQEAGGKIYRHPGGYWGGEKFSLNGAPLLGWFGSSTINALTARGLARISKWTEGRNGKFPTEVTVNG